MNFRIIASAFAFCIAAALPAGFARAALVADTKIANDTELGLVKVAQAASVDSIVSALQKDDTTTNDKNYRMKLDKGGIAYVTIPWTDTNTTYISGTGISISNVNGDNVISADGYTLPNADLNVLGGVKLAQAADSSALTLALTASTNTTGANFPLRLTNSQVAYVNIPQMTMTAPGVARLGAPDVNTNFMHLFEPIEVSLAPGVGSGVFFIKECEILDQNGQTVMKGGYDSENYICYNIFARHLPVQTQNGQLMVSVPAGILSMGGKSYDLSGLVELSNVAGTGDYSDLSNILLLNGAASNTGDQTFYAPTSSGTAGQILTSTGPNSAPSWANFPTAGLNVLGGVKLNQNADTSAVALTTGGTGGGNYPLKLSNTSVAYTNVPPATTSVFGVVKLGSDTVQTATAASGSPFSASGRTYPIQNNSGGQLVVNVPWTDSSTTPQLSFDEVFSGSSDPLPFSGLRLRVGDSAMDFIPIAGKFDYTVNYENNSIGVDDPINIYYDSYEQTGENNGLGLIRLFSNRDQEPLDWDCINGDSRHCLYGSSNGLLTNETMNNRDAQFYRVDGRNYPLKLDRVGVAYVTVPWESGGGGTYNYNELLNRLLLNGASGNTGDKTFYAPISGGTNGYILKSNGPSAAPDWMVPDTIPQLSAPPAGTPPTGRVFIWVQ